MFCLAPLPRQFITGATVSELPALVGGDELRVFAPRVWLAEEAVAVIVDVDDEVLRQSPLIAAASPYQHVLWVGDPARLVEEINPVPCRWLVVGAVDVQAHRVPLSA